MKSAAEFNRYYDQNIFSHISVLDKLRVKASFRKFLVIAALCLITIGVGFFAYYVNIYPVVKWAIVIFYLGSVGAIYKYEVKDSIRKYEDQFSGDLMAGMVHFISPSFTYDADKYIPEAGFCLSEIYGENSDLYNASDYVEGYVGATHLKFCQVHARMDRADFRGIFIMAGFSPEVDHPIIIITNNSYSDDEHNNLRLHADRPPLILTGNKEFDDKFSIFGKDHEEARQVLTYDLLDRILAYSRKVGKEINLSIHRSTLFMTISSDKLMFDPEYDAEPDKATLENWFKYLNSACDVVKDLGL
jgi:hypothetical protein